MTADRPHGKDTITLKSHKTVLPGRAEGETRAHPRSKCHWVDPTRLSEENSESLGFILPALFSKTNSGTSQKVYDKLSFCNIVPVFLSVRQAKRIESLNQTEIHQDKSQLTWELVGVSPGCWGGWGQFAPCTSPGVFGRGNSSDQTAPGKPPQLTA